MPHKIASLKNQKAFDAVNLSGKKHVGKFMIVVIARGYPSQATSLGLKVGRKYGNSVSRNKFKRRIRAIVQNFDKSYPGNSFIVIPKSHAINADYSQLAHDFYKINHFITEGKS